MPELQILPDSKLHSIAFDMLWLQMNYRPNFHTQLGEMSEAIKLVQEAAIRNKPIGEILRRCNRAVKACRGFV